MMKRSFASCITLVLLCLLRPIYAAPLEAPANLSEEAQAYLNTRPVGNLPEPEQESLETVVRMRGGLDKMFLAQALKLDPEVYTTPDEMGGIPVYWVNTPKPAKPGPLIIYLHGGGHILGSPQSSLVSPLRVSAAADMPVLSIQYRLAPEHPFPADVDDVAQVYGWLLDNGYRADQIGVYGESAGAALAVSLALKAREQGLPMPAAVAGLSGMFDVQHWGDSRIALVDIDPVLRQPLAKRYQMYVGDADPTDPLLSAVYADYRDFPPLLIQVGTRDRLLSDSVRLARKARLDGADVTLDVWDGMWHVWQGRPGVPEAEQACIEVAEFLRGHMVLAKD